MDLREFKERLMSLDPAAVEFPLWIDELIVGVPESLHSQLIPSMFEYVEVNPDFSNGSPGTMVHFIEAYYPIYKNMLLESLARNPSQMVVLMVNRILNSKLEPEERAEYTAALEVVRDNRNVRASVRKEADDFLKYQQKSRVESRGAVRISLLQSKSPNE